MVIVAVIFIADRPALQQLIYGRPFQVVVIDAGHGGKDPGAMANDLVEKNLALDLAYRLAARLRSQGIEVIMTRDDDTYLTLAKRVKIASKAGNAIFVSLHFNKEKSSNVSGIETFFYDPHYPEKFPSIYEAVDMPPRKPTAAELLAEHVQQKLVSVTGANDRGVKNYPYYVVRKNRVPAILVEGGFLSHSLESKMVANGGYRRILANAIADGILEFRGWQEQSRQLFAQKSPTSSP